MEGDAVGEVESLNVCVALGDALVFAVVALVVFGSRVVGAIVVVLALVALFVVALVLLLENAGSSSCSIVGIGSALVVVLLLLLLLLLMLLLELLLAPVTLRLPLSTSLVGCVVLRAVSLSYPLSGYLGYFLGDCDGAGAVVIVAVVPLLPLESLPRSMLT